MTEIVGNAGNFNIKKYLKSLGSKTDGGNTKSHLLKELCDNSFDANCKNINISFKENATKQGYGFISIHDDGEGMKLSNFKRLLEFYSYNYSNSEDNNGKYGIGAKRAIIGLSYFQNDDFNKSTHIITKNQEDEVLSCQVGWNTINNIQDFIDKIPIVKNDPISVQKIEKYKTGTFIEIETNSEIINELKDKLYLNQDNENEDDFMENRRDMDLFLDLGLSYSRYLTNHKRVSINGTNVKPFLFYENDTRPDVLKGYYDLYIYNSNDKDNKPYYTFKYEKKHYYLATHGKGFLKKFKELNTNIPPLYNEKGKITLSLAVDMSGSVLNEASKYIYKAPEHKFKGLIENINVVRGNKNLNTLSFKAKIAGDHDKRTLLRNIHSELIYSSKMDDIINITQDNKSVTNWDNTSKGFKTAIEQLHEEFIKHKVDPYRLIKEKELLEEIDDISSLDSSSEDSSSVDITSEYSANQELPINNSIPHPEIIVNNVNDNVEIENYEPEETVSQSSETSIDNKSLDDKLVDSDSLEAIHNTVFTNTTRHRSGHDVTISRSLPDCLILLKNIVDKFNIKEYIKSYQNEDNSELQTSLFKELMNLQKILEEKKLSDIETMSKL